MVEPNSASDCVDILPSTSSQINESNRSYDRGDILTLTSLQLDESNNSSDRVDFIPLISLKVDKPIHSSDRIDILPSTSSQRDQPIRSSDRIDILPSTSSQMDEANQSSDGITSLLPSKMTRWVLLGKRYAGRRKFYLCCAFYVIFMIIEIVGTCFAKSLAIVTDQLHLVSYMFWFIVSIGRRKPIDVRKFGFNQADVLRAFVFVIAIWSITIVVGHFTVEQLLKSDMRVDSNIMMITAALGLLGKGIILTILHCTGERSRSHGHAHAINPLYDNRGIRNRHRGIEARRACDSDQLEFPQSSSANVSAAIFHVISVIILSVAIFVVSIVIKYKPEWTFVDPACALLFGLLVLVTTIFITRDLITILRKEYSNTLRRSTGIE